MSLLFVIIYFALISNFGCFFLRKSKMDTVLIQPCGFMLGSVIIGGIMFLLASTKLIRPLPIGLLFAGILILGIFGASTAFRSLKAIKNFLSSHVYIGKYRVILLVTIIFGILLYLVVAYTPPRDADALRYHLPLIKDIIKHKGFVFRPYYFYGIPQYFHYLFTPLFMVIGGEDMQLTNWIVLLMVVFLTLYLSYRTNQTKHLMLLAPFLIFLPGITRASNVFNNDLSMLLYSLIGLLMIVEFGTKPQLRYLILAYISLGFNLGSKYQAILYIPIFMLATFLEMRKHWKFSARYLIMIILVFIPFLIASPFFIRNIYYVGDPIWPLMPDLFRVPKNYFYQVVQINNYSSHGNLTLSTLFRSAFNLAKDPRYILIIWVLCFGYYFSNFSWGKFYKIGILLFFGLWFISQPKLYTRFATFAVPLLAIMAISFCQWFHSKFSRFGKYIYILPVLSIIAGIGFSIIYSIDFLEYQVTRNQEKLHQSAWYYEQYQWINENIKDDGRFLLIIRSGQFYYLDKDYLRADPEFSGLIDWTAVKDVNQLKDILRNFNIRYIFYHDTNWEPFAGGKNMMNLISDLKSEGDIPIIFEDNKVKLTYLRILNKAFFTKVFVLDLSNLYKK